MSLKSKLTTTNATLWSPLLLRLALGSIFVGHGAQKLFGWWGGGGLKGTASFFETLGLHPSNFWAGLAGGGELLGGTLLILGLLTRFAALDIIVIMIVAIKTTYAGHFLMSSAGNGIELPVAVLAAAIVLLETGGGALSIDSKFGNGGGAAKK